MYAWCCVHSCASWRADCGLNTRGAPPGLLGSLMPPQWLAHSNIFTDSERSEGPHFARRSSVHLGSFGLRPQDDSKGLGASPHLDGAVLAFDRQPFGFPCEQAPLEERDRHALLRELLGQV